MTMFTVEMPGRRALELSRWAVPDRRSALVPRRGSAVLSGRGARRPAEILSNPAGIARREPAVSGPDRTVNDTPSGRSNVDTARYPPPAASVEALPLQVEYRLVW
jgi:hypothetical protein